MKKTTQCLTILSASFLLLGYAAHAEQISCDTAVKDLNSELSSKKMNTIADTKSLPDLLRTLNRGERLPASYVTRQQAIQMGWSGKSNDSLWSVWELNRKSLGGDAYSGEPKLEGRWYVANLDAVRGIPSAKYLVYSPDSDVRYVSTDNLKTLVKLKPCKYW
ncbi:TPA: ribonuclease [Citrobacter freundii]|nr:ribonuclease [Citrobacter freundii]